MPHPQPNPKLTKKQFSIFIRFLKLILPHKAKWVFIIVLSSIGSLLTLANPYITKLVIDDAVMNKDIPLFIILASIGIIIFTLVGVINGLSQYLERQISLKVKFNLNKEVFSHLSKLSLSWFRRNTTGENVFKINSDIERINTLITSVPPKAVFILLRIIFIFAIVLKLNYKIALFSLVLAPFLYIGPYYFMKRRRKVWEGLIKSSEGIYKFLYESFSHSYLIKVFGKEKKENEKYLSMLQENIDKEKNSAKLEIFNDFVARIADKIIVGLITFYGGYHVIKGTMTLGTLTAILVYLGQLVSMQSSFIGFFQSLIMGLVSCERIQEVLDEKDMILEKKDALSLSVVKGDIVFKRVSFGYLKDKNILENIDFAINGSKHISLAGRSGCGKTTILNLITRLYDLDRGAIFIDGVDIRDAALGPLKGQIGIALQESFLFNDTVKNNILYGKEHATMEEVLKAANIALVDDFVKGLKDRYDTIIGENACRLSEGQKQKISIARALIKNPKILILDEAFASMDSESEEKIVSNIKDNFKGMTLITVSHRLSTVKKSDLVYFLNSSNKVTIGPVEDMIENNREFNDLFKGQIEGASLVGEP